MRGNLESRGGVRVEIKQSAALQPWDQRRPSRPIYSISKQKSEVWDSHGNHITLTSPVRVADIYVFALHDEDNKLWTDQRLLTQWRFYVVPERELPTVQEQISLNPLKKLAEPVCYDVLPHAIAEAARNLTSLKRDEMKTLGGVNPVAARDSHTQLCDN